MELTEQIAQGDHAKRILEDPLVKEALADIKAAIIEQWVSLGVENDAQAKELKRLLWAADQFAAIFESRVAGATIARQELHMRENMEIKREAAKGRLYA
jgi:hypothetical protein